MNYYVSTLLAVFFAQDAKLSNALGVKAVGSEKVKF
jgi:hypothetical protein